MFTFMNAARLGVATEGVAAAEASFQGALAYAKDRLQMRSLSGVKNPDGRWQMPLLFILMFVVCY